MARGAMATILVALALAGTGSAAPAPGRLVVTQTYDSSRATYIEGSYGYVTVRRRRDHRLVYHARFGAGNRRSVSLAAGRYSVFSYQRPCEGTCAALDAPTDKCVAFFRIRSARRLTARIVVRPGEGCTIRFR